MQIEPFEQAGARVIHEFKLIRPSGLLLDHRCPCADLQITYDIADPDLYQITAPQLAVDSQIKKHPIANPAKLIQKEADCLNLLRFQCALCASFSACIPRIAFVSSGIKSQ